MLSIPDRSRFSRSTWARSACEPIGWAEADLARWQRAMRPIRLAVNLIHHPDEPDGVRSGDLGDPLEAADSKEDVLGSYSGFAMQPYFALTMADEERWHLEIEERFADGTSVDIWKTNKDGSVSFLCAFAALRRNSNRNHLCRALTPPVGIERQEFLGRVLRILRR